MGRHTTRASSQGGCLSVFCIGEAYATEETVRSRGGGAGLSFNKGYGKDIEGKQVLSLIFLDYGMDC